MRYKIKSMTKDSMTLIMEDGKEVVFPVDPEFIKTNYKGFDDIDSKLRGFEVQNIIGSDDKDIFRTMSPGDHEENKFYTAKAKDIMSSEQLAADKTDPDKDLFIFEGWASTNDKDRYGDIVDPGAWKKGLKFFKKNPIVLLMHRWSDLPIGRVLEAEIRTVGKRSGLWVRQMISETAPIVRKLIEEKILRAMSIGFRPIKIEWGKDGEPNIIKELELLENSIVNIPANPFTLGAAAKSLGIGPEKLKSIISNEEESMDRFMTRFYDSKDGGGYSEEAVRTIVKEAIAESSEVVAKAVAKEVSQITLKESIGSITTSLIEANRTSQADFNEKADKSKDEFFKKLAERDKDLIKQYGQIPGTKGLELGGVNPVPNISRLGVKFQDDGRVNEKDFFLKVLNKELPHINDDETRLINEFKDINDELFTAQAMAKAGIVEGGAIEMKNHPNYAYYLSLKARIIKAMDTQTATEGAEWVGVGYSTRLWEKVKLQLKVANLFQTINMPFPTMKLPTDMAEETGYLLTENLNDIGTKIRTLDQTTSEVSLDAKKLGARIVSSQELMEDALFAMLPLYMQKLIRGLARAVENAIINGDTSATHMDTGYTVEAWDARKAWDGLRDQTNIINSSARKDASGTIYGTTIRAARAAMGEYGVDPSQLALVVGVKGYVKMLDLLSASGGVPIVATIDKFGPQATYKTGTLAKIDGIDILVSPHVEEETNTAGIYDGTTTGHLLFHLVNVLGFIIGNRRVTKLAQKDDIETDQKIVVATQRVAFSKLTSSSLNPISEIYNVDE